MVRLFVRHKVTDYAQWRKVYDNFDAERKAMGVIADSLFRTVDNENEITVSHDFHTPEEAKSFVSSPKLKSAMQEGGVQGPAEIWYAVKTN